MAQDLSTQNFFENKQKNNHYIRNTTFQEGVKRLSENVDIAEKVLNYATTKSANDESVLFTASDLKLLAEVKPQKLFGSPMLPGMEKIHLTISKELQNNITDTKKASEEVKGNSMLGVASIEKFLPSNSTFNNYKASSQDSILKTYFEILEKNHFDFYKTHEAIIAGNFSDVKNKYVLQEVNHAFSALVLEKQLADLKSISSNLKSILDLSIVPEKERQAFKEALQSPQNYAKAGMKVFKSLLSEELIEAIQKLEINANNRDSSVDAKDTRKPLNLDQASKLEISNLGQIQTPTAPLFPSLTKSSLSINSLPSYSSTQVESKSLNDKIQIKSGDKTIKFPPIENSK